MPSIDTVTSVQSNPLAQSSSNAKASQVDYETFLKLLVAEMQNQDPTKPMDSTEYISQLASFSNVEQTIQTNEKLDLLLNQSQLSGASSLIGKTVTSSDGTVTGEVAKVKFTGLSSYATLVDGQQIPIVDGITISQ